MSEELYNVTFHKIMQSENYTIFVLRSEGKQFAIYSTPNIGITLQRILTQKPSPRPQTFDFIDSLFKGLDIKPFQFILHDMKDSVYYCKFFLQQTAQEEAQILEIDTRPSDGLILSLSHNLPIFCTKELLEKVPEYKD